VGIRGIQIVFAAVEADETGWDITARTPVVPGPGLLLALPLLAVGLRTLRKRR